MPYISRAQRERARWLTLAEAATAIQISDKCGPDSAWQQLRSAIADDEVQWKWDAPLPLKTQELRKKHHKNTLNRLPPHVSLSLRYKRSFWEKARADLKPPGRVLDDEGVLYAGTADRPAMFRELILLRSDIARLWPPSGQKSSPVVEEKDLPKLRAAPLADVLKTCMKVYRAAEESGEKPPNMNEAFALVRELLPNARRDTVWEVLRRPEFKELRWQAGKRHTSSARK